ncbi:hypothetical protein BS330_43515, partial [Amycolatopsis keratiniphila subsp. nogabecina]
PHTFRYVGCQHWDAIAKALNSVHTAPTEAVRLRDDAWTEFVPSLAFNPEIRRVICFTDAIERR